MKTRLVLMTLLFSAFSLIFFHLPLAFSDSGHGSQEEHHQAEHESNLNQHHGSHNVEDILSAIDAKQVELVKMVNSKKLDQIHTIAFAIRDLAKELPEKAAASKKARVEGAVKNISMLAERLDESGDAGNQQLTEINLKRLNGTLKMLDAQFSHYK